MKMRFHRLPIFAAALVLSLQVPVGSADAQTAEPGSMLLRRHAQAGTLAEGEKALAALVAAKPADAEARAALGFAKFARTIERLGQSLHRYGLRPPPNAGMMIPVLRFPVPPNSRAEPVDYTRMRSIYANLLADLAEVESTLAALPPGDFKLRIDLNAIRLDVDADGNGTPEESLGAILRDTMRPPGRRSPQSEPDPLKPWNVAFDRADTIWLRGYGKLLSTFSEFVLAHDWSEAFGATAQLFFPRVEGGNGIASLSQPDPSLGGVEASSIADIIAFLHMVRFPVVEPQRMKRARSLLLEAVALSRENWKAILAETDDEDEWLPSPKQKSSAIGNPGITEEIVTNWLTTLSQFEAALEGNVLVGHWRFNKGIDLKQVFEEPRTFDLVLWVTGPAAVPYLKDGETLTQGTVQQWQRMFGGNFLGFALWFN
jgi:hypothetical protein